MKNQEFKSIENPEMGNLKSTEVEQVKVLLTMPSTDQLGQLSGMKSVYKITASYRTQEEWQEYKDKPVRAFFLGMKELPNDDGEVVNCAIFADPQQIFLCAQYVLVEAVRNEMPNTPFEIIYKGKKQNKTSKGKTTNIFEISKLG